MNNTPIDRASVDLAYDICKDIETAVTSLESIGLLVEDGKGIGKYLYGAETKAVDIITQLLGIDTSDDAISEKACALILSAANIDRDRNCDMNRDIKGIPDKTLSALENLRNRKEDDPKCSG